MQNHETTHAELARTVDELQQWMSVVEAGLTLMLDRTTQDTIEEETEDGSVYDHYLQDELGPLPPPDGRTAASTPHPMAVALE